MSKTTYNNQYVEAYIILDHEKIKRFKENYPCDFDASHYVRVNYLGMYREALYSQKGGNFLYFAKRKDPYIFCNFHKVLLAFKFELSNDLLEFWEKRNSIT